MPRKPKFDYDSENFNDDVFTYAMQGFNDQEIADAIGLDPEVFNTMKNGKYVNWSDEENERRGTAIRRSLERGRRKINSIVRGRYLKVALGGLKTKNVSKVKRPVVDPVTGESIGEEVVQINETEFEAAPNVQAMANWLYHHDPEWRRVHRGQDVEASDIPTDISQGVDIDAWIKKETENNNNLTEE